MGFRSIVVVVAILTAGCTTSVPEASPTTTIQPISLTTAKPPPPTTAVQSSPPTTTAASNDPQPYVPPEPTHTDDEVVELAAALGVDRLLVEDGTDYVAVADGRAIRNSDGNQVWTDGMFIYWQERLYDDDAGTTEFVGSFAASFDWTVVCSFDEWAIHHVTQRPDGSLVAGVEQPWELRTTVSTGSERYGVPAFAVECSDGSSQPIASFGGYGGDSESWGVERVAGRVFTWTGDAEGNAIFFNEQELAITGDDIASYLVYNVNASEAAYGVYFGGWAAAPMMSVRMRNTSSAEILWTYEVESPITSIDRLEDRVLVGLFPASGQWNGWEFYTDQVLVLDAATGSLVDVVRSDLNIEYAG